MRSRIGRPSSKALLKRVVAVWQTPPPIEGSTSEPMIIWPSRKPRSAVRAPTTSLNENVAPGFTIVPSMKSAISWTLWIRFDDETPMSVVNEESLRVIPSLRSACVVTVGRTGASVDVRDPAGPA